MKLSKGQIIDLDVTSLAYGGMGISYYNDIVVFVIFWVCPKSER